MAKCMYMTVSSLFFSLPPFLPFFFSFVCAVSLFLLQKYCTTPAQNVRTCFMLSHRIRLSYAFFFFFIINACGQDGSCIHVQNSVKWKTRSILSYDIGPLTNGF